MNASSTYAPPGKPQRRESSGHKPLERTITVDASGKGVTLSHRTVQVDKAKDERLHWVCRGGHIRIVWDERIPHVRRDPNPFDAVGFVGPPREAIASGPILGPRGGYKYTLYVYPEANPKEFVTIDPQVDVIDTSLPPPPPPREEDI